MRVAFAIALGALVSSAAWASGTTTLRVVVRAKPGAAPRVTTLRCNPPGGGTVAKPAAACRRLLAGGRTLFAPTPPGTACSQIYGGPQEAVVSGTLAGARLWARFRRRDGCEVARWNRVAFLLGPLPASSG